MLSWAVEELKKLNENQPEIVERALQHLWKAEPHIYKSVVISAYIDEKISLSKAAELKMCTARNVLPLADLRQIEIISPTDNEKLVFSRLNEMFGKGFYSPIKSLDECDAPNF